MFHFMLDTKDDKNSFVWFGNNIIITFSNTNLTKVTRIYDNILKASKAALVQLVVPDSKYIEVITIHFQEVKAGMSR